MNKPFVDFIRTLKLHLSEIQLDTHVHAQIRETLLSYADMHEVVPVVRRSLVSTFFFNTYALRAAAVVLVFGVVFTGVAFASEKSLPGQPLYSVKLSIAEPMQGALQLTPLARADWSTQLVERRLTEATALAKDHALTEPVRAELETNLIHAASVATEQADILVQSGDPVTALSVRSGLEAHLDAHADLFAVLASNTEDTQTHTLAANVVAVRDSVAQGRQENADILSRSGNDLTQTDIEAAVNATNEVATSILTSGGAAFASIQDRLNTAQGSLSNAKLALVGNDSGSAYVALDTASRAAQEASILADNQDVLSTADTAPTHADEGAGAAEPVAAKTVPVAVPAAAIMRIAPAATSTATTTVNADTGENIRPFLRLRGRGSAARSALAPAATPVLPVPSAPALGL